VFNTNDLLDKKLFCEMFKSANVRLLVYKISGGEFIANPIDLKQLMDILKLNK
jgi:hypothetical protein